MWTDVDMAAFDAYCTARDITAYEDIIETMPEIGEDAMNLAEAIGLPEPKPTLDTQHYHVEMFETQFDVANDKIYSSETTPDYEAALDLALQWQDVFGGSTTSIRYCVDPAHL